MSSERIWEPGTATARTPDPLAAASASIILSATFTADPLLDTLRLFMRETELDLDVGLAPYGQVFQELLDRTRAFSKNHAGVNVLLVRFEDWVRDANGEADLRQDHARVASLVDDLLRALREATLAIPAPIVLCLCPSRLYDKADPETQGFLAQLENKLLEGIRDLPSVHLLPGGQIGSADGAATYDAEADRLGHLPYTPAFFTRLGMAIARLVHSLKSPPRKVLVLDCDNTLWKGAVGEEGARGVEITERHRELQRFALAQKNAGMLLCLASKNVEADVTEVLRERDDMILRAEDFVSMRVNWLPKSENLRSLAAELNLGLDSFVLVDDSPVECAEVGASCPEVLTVCLPAGDDFPRFLENIWPLDRPRVTEEDAHRTEAYRQNRERTRHQASATSFAEFLEGLELRVEIGSVRPEQLARVAQLTQRTNQFNLTTHRWSEGQIALLGNDSLECRVVEVKDRFGDYGLVGVLIFGVDGSRLVIDTFLLSCRVLGRGVEHAMLRELGTIAESRGLSWIWAPFIPTKKNLPAKIFLDSLEAESREETEQGTQILLPARRAAGVVYAPEASDEVPSNPAPSEPTTSIAAARDDAQSARWNRIARDFDTPEKVLAFVDGSRRRPRRSADGLAPPRTETERKLCAIWAEELGISQVGLREDYFDLGGTSLVAVAIFARVEREMGKRLPLAVLMECKTVESLAARIESFDEIGSLVVLERGGAGLPLYLVHDVDGETLLYRNLARRLGGRPVYGIQPLGRQGVSIVQTRIAEMAAHYVAEIRKVQPRGPYFLGGLCAGGILASEMARQLEATNEEARLVAVFDAADVGAPIKPNLETVRRLTRVRQALGSASIARVPLVLLTKARGYLRYQIRTRGRNAYDRLLVSTLRRYLDRGARPPRWVRKVSVRAVYSFAEAEYQPRHVLREEIVLFRATAGVDLDEPYVQLYADPLLGWGSRSAKGVAAIDVPGGHGSMLQEPHVAAIANSLRSYLAQADPAARPATGSPDPYIR